MNMQERIIRTEAFVKEQLAKSEHFRQVPRDGVYRWDHIRRVAGIGRQIAREEGLDEERLVLGCLLHDVSYCNEYETDEIWQEHGRDAARIARPFLQSLALSEDAVQEICYGIAIHVDGRADFEGERTPLALSIGDCDHIDRVDAYRLYETLHRRVDYESVTGEERIALLRRREQHLAAEWERPMATAAATRLWQDCLGFQREFYRRLREQMERTTLFG